MDETALHQPPSRCSLVWFEAKLNEHRAASTSVEGDHGAIVVAEKIFVYCAH